MHSNLVRLHLVVVIFAFTAILGKLISAELPTSLLVFYRMVIACAGLYVYVRIRRRNLAVSRRIAMGYLGVGGLVALHWIFFFHAIKVSNVSVTLGCFASAAFFTSLLEPLITRGRYSRLNIILSVVAMSGLYMIFRFELTYVEGMVLSLLSALLAGLFTVINKKMVSHGQPLVMSFYEMLGGAVVLGLYNLYTGSWMVPAGTDLIYLLILGLVCTSVAFVMSIDVMKTLSAFQVSMTVNLEPVYGILLAVMIFGDSEWMSPGFYAGAAIVLLAVLVHPWLEKLG
ncbi:MAG: DMT family transporter [Flavobacteriales bacterium]|nr:DMT family transporter [Flavobacteriales bacterium]